MFVADAARERCIAADDKQNARRRAAAANMPLLTTAFFVSTDVSSLLAFCLLWNMSAALVSKLARSTNHAWPSTIAGCFERGCIVVVLPRARQRLLTAWRACGSGSKQAAKNKHFAHGL